MSDQTSHEFLFHARPPWIWVGQPESNHEKIVPSAFYTKEGWNVCVRTLRGWKMRTFEGLMDEVGAALQLFGGFGENWHALEECLMYMDEWLPSDGFVIIVDRAEELLVDASDSQLEAFIRTFSLAGEFLARPITDNGRFNRKALPFHVLCLMEGQEKGSMERIMRSARHSGFDCGVLDTEPEQP